MPTTDGLGSPRGHDEFAHHPDFPHLSPGRRHRRRWIGRVVALVVVVAVVFGGYVGINSLRHYLGSSKCQLSANGQVQSFDPEQSANAATISAVAVRRGLPARAATIALTTAIQESKLRNLKYGDRDSLGLFQQRPSQGWGTAAQIQDAVHAANAFYDQLVTIPGYAGKKIGEMAQEVQRSGYPTAYADHEEAGRVLASVLTGQTPAGIGCRLGDPTGASDPASTATKITDDFGVSAQRSSKALTVRAGSSTSAWAVGAWAVAHADAEQVTSVTVGRSTWTRSSDKSAWTWAPAAKPLAATTVRVELA